MNVLTSRLGSASGALGAGLLFAGLTRINAATSSLSPDSAGSTIASNYLVHRDDIRLGVTIALAGAFLTFWFLGYLRQVVRGDRDEGRWLADVAFGGGLVGLAAILVHLAVLVAATNGSILIAPETARTLFIVGWEYGGIAAPAFGAFVGATSIAIIRYALVPGFMRLVAWVGLLLAAALGFSGFLGGVFVVLTLPWLAITSLAFLVPTWRRGGRLAVVVRPHH